PAAPTTTTVVTATSVPPATSSPAVAPASGGSVPSSGGTTGGSGSSTPTPATNSQPPPTSNNSGNTNPYGLPSIKHVFVITLADQGYSQTFGSTDSYMAKTLPKQGKLMTYYYAVAGGDLANQIALVSGQGPTDQ